MENLQNNSFFYQRQLYIITAKTNMHVGSGEETYGLIDNRVQRDVLTNLPNINSSGLKGALREYFSQKFGERSQEVIEIFGSDSFEKTEESDKPDESKKHQAGKFRFFNANLLSIPVRSNVRPFFRATSPQVIEDLIDTLDTFGYDDTFELKQSLEQLLTLKLSKEAPLIFSGDEGVILEDSRIKAVSVDNTKLDRTHLNKIEAVTGAPLAFMHNIDFNDMCSDFNLPLIARNKLEDGRSENLWHEQVVPRETKFYFFVLKPTDSNHNLLFSSGEPVQIGANASIGYGFCHINEAAELFEGVSVEKGEES